MALDSSGLSGISAVSLCEDTRGNVWIGTKGNGITVYDRTNKRYIEYQHLPGNSSSLSNNVVHVVYQDRVGRLWIGTDNGLNIFDYSRGTFRRFLHDANDNRSLSGTFVFDVKEDVSGNIWIATDYGLNKYLPATENFEHVYFEVGDDVISNHINVIQPDNHGRLWLGTYYGLGVYDPQTKSLRSLFHEPYNPSSLSNNVIYKLLRDDEGTLWVGTEQGLNVLQHCEFLNLSDTFRFVRYTAKPDNPRSLRSDNIRCLYQDRAGIVWVGTLSGGLHSWSRYRHKFPPVTTPDGAHVILRSASVRCFFEVPNSDTVWVGTDQGLVLLRRAQGFIAKYRLDSTIAQFPVPYQIWTIHPSGTGALWLGTNRGLVYYQPGVGILRHFWHNSGDPGSLSGDAVRSFCISTSGTIWIGTTKGLNKYLPDRQKFERLNIVSTKAGVMSDNRIMSLCEDRFGELWIGTAFGLYRFQPLTGVWKNYLHSHADSHSLSNNWIKAIREDKTGTLWIATAGGLNKFNREKETFYGYGLKHGFSNEHLYGLEEDRSGYLWISTNQGLVRFDPRRSHARCYTTEDGLQSNEFNTNAFYKNVWGELFFGGPNGFNTFVPALIQENKKPPEVVVTGLKIFGKARDLEHDIPEIQLLLLSHQENFVEFEFAVMDFTNPAQNRYMYKLDGIDQDWIAAGSRNFAPYTNLADGEYYFHIKGCNSDGVWSAKYTLHVVIEPPVWRAWWFRLMVGASAVLIVVALYLRHIRSIERQKQELEQQVALRTAEIQEHSEALQRSNEELAWANQEISRQNVELQHLNQEKNEFLGIAAHDLKNPLARIISLADLMGYESDSLSHEEVQEFSGLISGSANKMLILITNLLDVNSLDSGSITLRPEKLDVIGLVRRSAAEFQIAAHAKHIALKLECPDHPVSIVVDSTAFTQVIDNLLSNAIKYSPFHRSVYLSVQEVRPLHLTSHTMVQIRVRDEGPGLNEADKQQLFQRFTRLSAQPTAGEFSTGLGLSIVKKFVELMHGSIRVESKTGQGATFIVEVPLSD